MPWITYKSGTKCFIRWRFHFHIAVAAFCVPCPFYYCQSLFRSILERACNMVFEVRVFRYRRKSFVCEGHSEEESTKQKKTSQTWSLCCRSLTWKDTHEEVYVQGILEKGFFLWPYCCPYGNARTHRSVCSIHAHGKDVGNFILLERIFGFIEYQYIEKMPEFAQYDESKSILYRHGTMSKRIPLEFSWDFYSRRLAELVLLDIAIVQRKCFPKKKDTCAYIEGLDIWDSREELCRGIRKNMGWLLWIWEEMEIKMVMKIQWILLFIGKWLSFRLLRYLYFDSRLERRPQVKEKLNHNRR